MRVIHGFDTQCLANGPLIPFSPMCPPITATRNFAYMVRDVLFDLLTRSDASHRDSEFKHQQDT